MALAGYGAVITGGATGTGAGCARALAAEGAHVLVAGARRAEGEALAAELPRVRFLCCDAAEAGGMPRIERAARGLPHGAAIWLINTGATAEGAGGRGGGAAVAGRLPRPAAAEWRRMLAADLSHAAEGVALAHAHMEREEARMRGQQRRIVVTASIADFPDYRSNSPPLPVTAESNLVEALLRTPAAGLRPAPAWLVDVGERSCGELGVPHVLRALSLRLDFSARGILSYALCPSFHDAARRRRGEAGGGAAAPDEGADPDRIVTGLLMEGAGAGGHATEVDDVVRSFMWLVARRPASGTTLRVPLRQRAAASSAAPSARL